MGHPSCSVESPTYIRISLINRTLYGKLKYDFHQDRPIYILIPFIYCPAYLVVTVLHFILCLLLNMTSVE